MLRVVMVESLEVQVLLPDLLLGRSVQLLLSTVNHCPVLSPIHHSHVILLTHHSQQVYRWFTVQLMTELKRAMWTWGHVTLV